MLHQRRVYMIHGWSGSPESGFKPWLSHELTSRGYEVSVPAMPASGKPRIETWIPFLHETIKEPDGHTVLLGHSLGAKAILLYLSELPEPARVGKVVLVAPVLCEVAGLSAEEQVLFAPWLAAQLDPTLFTKHTEEIVAFFSDNDPWVPLSNETFARETLKVRTIIEHDKGHYGQDTGDERVPSILHEIIQR